MGCTRKMAADFVICLKVLYIVHCTNSTTASCFPINPALCILDALSSLQWLIRFIVSLCLLYPAWPASCLTIIATRLASARGLQWWRLNDEPPTATSLAPCARSLSLHSTHTCSSTLHSHAASVARGKGTTNAIIITRQWQQQRRQGQQDPRVL